ncbi:TonB-dependent receptor [candidate division KSB1 bacterium]|nr:TonB-dependent receptor [candidate division KSB1 bacterium]
MLRKVRLLTLWVMIFLMTPAAWSQTTGKLAGRVTDNNGEPLIGANVLLVNTSQGAAADMDGYYVILNVRAGTYTMRFDYIGFQSKVVESVRVQADQTTKIDVMLQPMTIEGEEVVVVAERPIVEFNQTSSISTVDKEEMQQLPVQALNEIVNLQAGVVEGHFRGGRIGEVQFQVDGVTVNNPYDNSSSIQLDRSVLEQVQIISGTFDAKYGQAMSGVVNAVLKSGSDKFEWSGEIYGGDFYTSDELRYPHNQKFNPIGIQNYQMTISGPLPIPKTTFFLSGRRYTNDGYLFGVRRFMPTDSSNLEQKIFYPTGDDEIIPMANREEWSGQFKITNKSLKALQLSYQMTLNDITRKSYNHSFRLNPDGTSTKTTLSLSHGLQMTHTVSDKMFYKVDFRQNYFNYADYYYEDVYDSRYLDAGSPKSDANYEEGAVVQGLELNRFIQKTNSGIAKVDLTWQANRTNLIESGIELNLAEMSFGAPGVLRDINVDGVQKLQPTNDFPGVQFVDTYFPRQAAVYLQDRVEWGDLILRAGLRYEYFDANATVPSDLENPANAIEGAPQSRPVATTIKSALAPRLGFSFPLTNAASIYFSYGHFYQMPGLGLLYDNADYSVLDELQAGGISYGVMGNPDLKPEFTVQYEFGLKQALTSFLGIELTFFHKDIRDLLGVEFISTYAAAEYPRFTNVDFGNVSGFTIALDQRAIGPVSTTLDYTMQFAQGNSSDPRETSTRASSGKDPRPRDIPFNWDQRHTLNATAIVYRPNNYSLSAIMRFGSGQPYTPAIGSGFAADLETNSGRKDDFFLVDLRAEKFFNVGPARMSAFVRLFNLLNTHFANGFVFTTTGSPDYTQFPAANRAALIDPSRFYEPRRIEIGLSFSNR